MVEEYRVLARRFRPHRFCDVVGQEATVTTLKNAIRKQRVAHAYLFSGPRGTGKTTLARLFASALNCRSLSAEGEPCTTCASCKEIASGFSLNILEIDGASHRGIEDIRKINETIGFIPVNGPFKIYLIDEVHMLTKEAFNALLKTLEEPPPHVKFFFATTEPHKIPATILSRCQRFQLLTIAQNKIQEKLASIAKELSISYEQEALSMIASLADGSLRDAESLFDQVIAFHAETISTQTVTEALGLSSPELFFILDAAGAQKKLTAAFEIAGQVFDSGKNIGYFVEELLSHFRHLFLIRNGQPPPPHLTEKYLQSARLYRDGQLLAILEYLAEAHQTLKVALCEKTALEMLLLRILRTHQPTTLEHLVDKLVELEKKLSIPPPASPIDPPAAPKTQEPLPSPSIEPINLSFGLSSSDPEGEKPKTQVIKSSIQEKSRIDTLMRFAAKELNGSLEVITPTKK